MTASSATGGSGGAAARGAASVWPSAMSGCESATGSRATLPRRGAGFGAAASPGPVVSATWGGAASPACAEAAAARSASCMRRWTPNHSLRALDDSASTARLACERRTSASDSVMTSRISSVEISGMSRSSFTSRSSIRLASDEVTATVSAIGTVS